jgi:hypothetical protein
MYRPGQQRLVAARCGAAGGARWGGRGFEGLAGQEGLQPPAATSPQLARSQEQAQLKALRATSLLERVLGCLQGFLVGFAARAGVKSLAWGGALRTP